MWIDRHIDFFHGTAVIAGIVHTGGNSRGRGVKVLYLFRHISQIPEILSQLHRLLHGRTRMGGHEIGHQILLLAQPLVHLLILLHKLAVNAVPGLSQAGQHLVRHMLRRHLKLTADTRLPTGLWS